MPDTIAIKPPQLKCRELPAFNADKLDAVRSAGIKLFVVPYGQSTQGGVDLAATAEREFGIQWLPNPGQPAVFPSPI